MTWCGFIDLLGTKESANASEGKLRQGLSDLHSTLRDNFDLLDDGVCFAFSDGAFFQSASLSNFANFYRSVRQQLFSNGHFFKCAVTRGDLTLDTSYTHGQGLAPLSESRFVSIRFGGAAPRAFLAQDRFKGVGAIIADPVGSDSIEKESFVRSFFFASDQPSSVKQYLDIRFTPNETGLPSASDDEVPWEDRPVGDTEDSAHSFLDIFLQEFSKAKSRSKRYGRYYLPTLAAMVRSLDFSNIDYDGNEWHGAPFLFEKLLVDKGFDSSYSDIKGLSFLYWTVVDELMMQRADLNERSKNELLICLLKRRSTFKEIDSIPDFILSSDVREDLLSRKGKLDSVMSKFRPR